MSSVLFTPNDKYIIAGKIVVAEPRGQGVRWSVSMNVD